ncbi:MAG: hypothetical protein ACE5FM_02980 [Methyloligellaceae bacterium]
MEKIIATVWRAIELLVQIIIIFVLAALLLGDKAGTVVNLVYFNVQTFLITLPPSSIAVALLIAVFVWWYRK